MFQSVIWQRNERREPESDAIPRAASGPTRRYKGRRNAFPATHPGIRSSRGAPGLRADRSTGRAHRRIGAARFWRHARCSSALAVALSRLARPGRAIVGASPTRSRHCTRSRIDARDLCRLLRCHDPVCRRRLSAGGPKRNNIRRRRRQAVRDARYPQGPGHCRRPSSAAAGKSRGRDRRSAILRSRRHRHPVDHARRLARCDRPQSARRQYHHAAIGPPALSHA